MKQLIKYLIFIYLILFPFGNLFRVKISDTVHVVPQDIIVGLVAVLLVGFIYSKRSQAIQNKFFVFQLLFVAFGLVSLGLNFLTHSDMPIIVSISYAVRYIAYLLLIFSSFIIRKEKMLNAFFVSGYTFLLFGFIQYFFFFDLRPLFYLGWDDHLYRLTSTFFDPNFAGTFLVVLFIVSFNHAIEKKFKEGYLFTLGSLLSLLGIYLTFSRTALVGLIVGIVTLFIIKKKLKMLVIISLFFVSSAILLSDTSVEGLNPLRLVSVSNRFTNLNQTVSIVLDNSISGVGFNSYRYFQLRYGFREEEGAAMSNSDAGSDNSILFVLATTGIIGFVFYSISYIWLLFGMKKYETGGSYILPVISVALIAASMFTNILFFMPLMGIYFLLISIFAVRADK